MAQTVVGVFDNSSDAQRAVDSLVSNGFMRDNIDLSAASATDMTGTASNTTGTTTTGHSTNHDGDDFGDSVGRFFGNLFGSDDTRTTQSYSDVARQSSVVTVHTTTAEESEQAADILDEYGAVNIDERAAQYATGTNETGAMATGATAANMLNTDVTTDRMTTNDDTVSVPIIEENISVGKQMVETGGVRLRSRIVERPVEESVRLREERVLVQRNPVNRAATDADFGTFKEGDVEMIEHAERAVIAKEARVVEEVTLGKEATERDETISDTVRRTEVDVENIGGTNVDTTDTTRRTGTGL